MSSATPQPSPVKEGGGRGEGKEQHEEEEKHGGVVEELELELEHHTAHHVREVVHEVNSALDMDVCLKHQAAIKIQSKFRCRVAKRKSNHMKQLKKGRNVKDAAVCSKLKPKLVTALKKVFQFYCPNDDIDREGFVWLLKDGGLLGHNYLSMDADHNFSETIAKVELSDTPRKYSPGVRYGKRFTFLVFKDIALSFVALSKGMSYEAVVGQILDHNPE